MNGPRPLPQVPGASLDDQKALVRRARRDAWHWSFRAVVLALISGLALKYGWIIFGVAFGVLALMAWGLVRSIRRRAATLAAMIQKVEGGDR